VALTAGVHYRSSPMGLRVLARFVMMALALLLAAVSPLRAQEKRSPLTNFSPRPVIITGRQAPALLGLKIDTISMARCVGGVLGALTYQIDERNPDGFVLPDNPAPKLKPDEKPGIFDENDEIVFMFRDTGPACEQLPENVAGQILPLRIDTVIFPQPRYVYALVDPVRRPPMMPYVTYSAAKDRVTSPAMEVGAMQGNAAMIDHLVFPNLKGRETENVLDRLKVRITSRAVADLVTIRIDEDDLKSTLWGARAGPVRVVRHVNVVLTPVPGFTIPVTMESVQYDRLWEPRIYFTLPKSLAAFMTSQDMRFIVDFRDLRGMNFVTVVRPEGAMIDGVTGEAERDMGLGDERWFFVTGKGLNVLMMMFLSDNLKLKSNGIFIDSREDLTPPEAVPGTLPSAGFHFSGWENIKGGTYSFGGRIVTLPGFPEDGGSGWYRTYSAPIEITPEPRK